MILKLLALLLHYTSASVPVLLPHPWQPGLLRSSLLGGASSPDKIDVFILTPAKVGSSSFLHTLPQADYNASVGLCLLVQPLKPARR